MKTYWLFGFLLISLPLLLEAKTITLHPIADTSISTKEPYTSFGDSDTLAVGIDGTYDWQTLIRFDYSEIPHGSVITSAKLQMVRFEGAGRCHLYDPGQASWQEGSTWDSLYWGPDWGLFRGSVELSECSAGSSTLWEWPTTPVFVGIVQASVDGRNGRTPSFGLVCSDGLVGFMSRNSGATSPKLVITYTPPYAMTGLAISGPGRVNENSGASYTCRATHSDGSTEDVSASVSWSVNSPSASIDSKGRLTTTAVSGSWNCLITATYEGQSDELPVTIVDTADPATIRFKTAAVSVAEGGRKARIRVIRTGDTSDPASVTFRTAAKTALARWDYLGKSGTLSWGAGDASEKTISILIIDDGRAEPKEVFKVLLSNPSGASLGSPSAAKVTIPAHGG